MKILFAGFVDLAIPGGDTTHSLELVGHLAKRGHEVVMVAQSRSPVRLNIPFYNSGAYLHQQSRFLQGVFMLVSLVRAMLRITLTARHMDLIYVRDYLAGLASIPALIFWKKSMVYEMNGIVGDERRQYGDDLVNRFFTRFLEWSERLTVRKSSGRITVTRPLKTYLIDQYGVDPASVYVIHNGVNTGKFRPLPAEALRVLRKELRIENETAVAVFVGTLSAWQGVENLLMALKHVKDHFPQIRLLVVGDGPLYGELQEVAAGLGLGSHVTFTGLIPTDWVPEYINLADICIAPFGAKRNQRCGVSPIKIYEYMACGKPILTTRIIGLDFVQEEGIGRLVEPDNPDALAKGMIEMLDQPEWLEEAGKRAARLAVECHSWSMVAEKVEEVCQQRCALVEEPESNRQRIGWTNEG